MRTSSRSSRPCWKSTSPTAAARRASRSTTPCPSKSGKPASPAKRRSKPPRKRHLELVLAHKRCFSFALSTQIDIRARYKSVQLFPRHARHVHVKQFALQIQSDGSRAPLFVKPAAQSTRIVFDSDSSQRKTRFILYDMSSNGNHLLTTLFVGTRERALPHSAASRDGKRGESDPN